MGRFAVAELIQRDVAGLAHDRLDARQKEGKGGQIGQIATQIEEFGIRVNAISSQRKEFRNCERPGFKRI
jgi:hypothetical protein